MKTFELTKIKDASSVIKETPTNIFTVPPKATNIVVIENPIILSLVLTLTDVIIVVINVLNFKKESKFFFFIPFKPKQNSTYFLFFKKICSYSPSLDNILHSCLFPLMRFFLLSDDKHE